MADSSLNVLVFYGHEAHCGIEDAPSGGAGQDERRRTRLGGAQVPDYTAQEILLHRGQAQPSAQSSRQYDGQVPAGEQGQDNAQSAAPRQQDQRQGHQREGPAGEPHQHSVPRQLGQGGGRKTQPHQARTQQ